MAMPLRDACREAGIKRRPGREQMITERLKSIETFRIQRAQSLSPGSAKTVDILAAMCARAAREQRFCSIYAPGIDWPAVEGDNPDHPDSGEAGR